MNKTKDFALKYEGGKFDNENIKNQNICECWHRDIVHFGEDKTNPNNNGYCMELNCPCKKFEKKGDKE